MKHYRLPVIFALLVLACVLGLVERSSIKPRIVQPFEFEELTVSSFDQVPDVDSLFDQKISMGGQDGYEFLRLDIEDHQSYVRVETAGQYLEMRRKGAVPALIEERQQLIALLVAVSFAFGFAHQGSLHEKPQLGKEVDFVPLTPQ